jgi:primosomal protein N' (replication factor Y)
MTLAVQVAVPLPVRHFFDYALSESAESTLRPGQRVRVPLGRRTVVGVVVSIGEAATAEGLRPILAQLDDEPLLSSAQIALCQWAAAYYQQPIGPMLLAALPGPLRRGAGELPGIPWLACTEAGRSARATLPARARRLAALLDALEAPRPLTALRGIGGPALERARGAGWIIEIAAPAVSPQPRESGPMLSEAQARALAAMPDLDAGFAGSLLEGVTGSGKTELYLRLAEAVLARGRQVLALAPEIGLTPQLSERFRQRFGDQVACYHSGMSDGERQRCWQQARRGEVAIVVGTRSAVFLPLARPGLIVVDEEHDASYRQAEGVIYSARDLAAVRARNENIPLLLGSATPALETLANASSGRYRHIELRERAGGARLPRLGLIDVRRQPLEDGLSPPLLARVREHLDQGGQVLLFLNRRGYAPVLLCHACGWAAGCPHCDARLTVHRRANTLRCHHCGYREALPKVCPQCTSPTLLALGEGTERTEEALRRAFPEVRIERIDSDRTRSARHLGRLFADVHAGAVNILVGTQMLAKGHDFPRLTFAGLINTDAALFSNDFRATERMAQQITQVAGRVGRAERPGEVLLQTHCPQHPLLRELLTGGYPAVARLLLAERQRHGLPPFAHLALLRADAATAEAASAFLEQARQQLPEGLEAYGPVAAPMERRAGRYRAQLLLRAAERRRLQGGVARWLTALEALPPGAGVRWRIEIDPGDLY